MSDGDDVELTPLHPEVTDARPADEAPIHLLAPEDRYILLRLETEPTVKPSRDGDLVEEGVMELVVNRVDLRLARAILARVLEAWGG